MRKILIAAALGMVVTACAPKQAPEADNAAQAPSDATEQPATDAITAQPPANVPGASVTFDGQGIVFPFEYVQRYDRVQEVKNGRKQRQIFVEVKGGDVDGVLEQLTEAMAQAGYKASVAVDDKGGKRLIYKKKGERQVHALVRPKSEKPKLKDPAATASIYFAVNEKTPKPVATSP
jgi:hypothetical protein